MNIIQSKNLRQEHAIKNFLKPIILSPTSSFSVWPWCNRSARKSNSNRSTDDEMKYFCFSVVSVTMLTRIMDIWPKHKMWTREVIKRGAKPIQSMSRQSGRCYNEWRKDNSARLASWFKESTSLNNLSDPIYKKERVVLLLIISLNQSIIKSRTLMTTMASCTT